MKTKFVSLFLIIALVFTTVGTSVQTAAAEEGHDVLREIFSGIDSVEPDVEAERLPYRDGTVLSDVREPLSVNSSGSGVFGSGSSLSDNLSWSSGAAPRFASPSVTLGGRQYSLGSEIKILAMSEGDFDNDGRKNELAVIAAARTTGGKSLLLLCTAEAPFGTLNPVKLLYDGSAAAGDFYADTASFANCIAVVCADVNGDGYDEIATATPTNGFYNDGTDKYGFDVRGGYYLWSLNEDGRTADGYKSAAQWCDKPFDPYIGLRMTVPDCHIGAPGVTVSLAAGDADGDGYDDITSAIATTKAQYNANYCDNMFSVYCMMGAANFDEMYLRRKPLTIYIDKSIKDFPIDTTSGDASGFDVAMCDVDDTGRATIFMSVKETQHRWRDYGGDKMVATKYCIYSFDYTESGDKYIASLVHKGGIYHNGFADGISDTRVLYRTAPQDCAPIRIGVLKGDFGLSDGKKGSISSGTVVVDQKYIPFVRYADGNSYRYETVDKGTYTGFNPGTADLGFGYTADKCIFFGNGTNVTGVRTANVSFDGTNYTDAALVSAYDETGRYMTYYLLRSGSGYGASLLSEGTADAAIAMPDVDSDSIFLKYVKHKFFWADPVIIAALASPPYFGSLPSDMYTNGSTTYGRSATSASGRTESYTVSAGMYISTEIKAGGGGTAAVFESETEAMHSSSIDREKTKQVEYTQSFSASGGEDTVVLSTVAYDAYEYTAYYQGTDGSLTSSPYIVYVPRGGSDAIKIASLPYDTYKEFITYANGALPTLADVFTHKLGKPETYPSAAPNARVKNGSVMVHSKLGSFPSGKGSQTLAIDITEEKAETSSSGSSVSVKLGGGFESEADDIFNLVDMGAKVTAGSSASKEHESGRITTNAVGTSFEGTVFGQDDGMNVSGSGEKKAAFNWRLLSYVYNFAEGNEVQQFPVVTYITSGVEQPEGVVPQSVEVSPSSQEVSQVGPATKGFVNTANFSVSAPGVTREAYTALEGAPHGMTLDTGGANIGTEKFPFGININANVQPGTYPLRLNIGGVLSDEFTVKVTEYTEPVWIAADRTEIDFGSMRCDEVNGTPAAGGQTVTVSNIHTEGVSGLAASFGMGDESPFEITRGLSSAALNPKGAGGDSATLSVAPKKGLETGRHTDTLKVTNGVTSAYVELVYNVTSPTLPGEPRFTNNMVTLANPIKLSFDVPEDNGGARITHYLYTIRGHADYSSGGEAIWKRASVSPYSNINYTLELLNDTLPVGESYVIGLKAVNNYGEGAPAWYRFEVVHSENEPGTVRNMSVCPGNGKLTVTWDEPDYWGANEFVKNEDIVWKNYEVSLYEGDKRKDVKLLTYKEGNEYTFTSLENGKKYEIRITARTTNCFGEAAVMEAVPSAEPAAPSRPKGLAAELSYKQAKLTWRAPEADGNSAVTGYEVSKDGGANWTGVGMSTEYAFTELTPNSRYEFAVRAANSAGKSTAAYTYQVIPNSLAAPRLHDTDNSNGLRNGLMPGYGQLELSWYPVDGDNITYEVKVDGGEWEAAEPVVFGDTLRYIFTGLENDRTYKIYVRAVDGEGPGPAAVTSSRKPRAIAPQLISPEAKPRNGAIQLFAKLADNQNPRAYMRYSLDGDTWSTVSDGGKITDLENGREYTVAVCAEGIDDGNMPLRTVYYLKCTPDETVPDEPSEPQINVFANDDGIRIEWTVESDGGAEITQYKVLLNGEGEFVLPKGETSLEIKCTPENRGQYTNVNVTAVNAVGESTGYEYFSARANLVGEDRIIVPPSHGEVVSGAYRLEELRIYDDGDGNVSYERADISEYAAWSMESDHVEITWDESARRIRIAEGLPDGEYYVTVTAKTYYDNVTYERRVKIIVGEQISIESAERTDSGVRAVLNLPEAYGKVVLCTAAYAADGRVTAVDMREISGGTLTDGAIIVPIDVSGAARVKVMMLDAKATLKPLCGSKEAR